MKLGRTENGVRKITPTLKASVQRMHVLSKADAILTTVVYMMTRISYSHDGSHPTYGATYRM